MLKQFGLFKSFLYLFVFTVLWVNLKPTKICILPVYVLKGEWESKVGFLLKKELRGSVGMLVTHLDPEQAQGSFLDSLGFRFFPGPITVFRIGPSDQRIKDSFLLLVEVSNFDKESFVFVELEKFLVLSLFFNKLVLESMISGFRPELFRGSGFVFNWATIFNLRPFFVHQDHKNVCFFKAIFSFLEGMVLRGNTSDVRKIFRKYLPEKEFPMYFQEMFDMWLDRVFKAAESRFLRIDLVELEQNIRFLEQNVTSVRGHF